MIELSKLEIYRESGNATIELLKGDLSLIPPEHAVDVLVISAFPNNYDPVPGTLVSSLLSRGLNVSELAQDKEEDLRTKLGCWLSKPISSELQQRLQCQRLMCFEPKLQAESAEKVVGNVFRCLNYFVIPDVDMLDSPNPGVQVSINKIAMPILASGNQKVPLALMLPAMLKAAIFWLQRGLPISDLKLVAFSDGDAAAALKIFEEIKLEFNRNIQARNTFYKKSVEPGWKRNIREKLNQLVDESFIDFLLKDLYDLAENNEKQVLENLVAKWKSHHPANVVSNPVEEDYDIFISYAHKDEKVMDFVEAVKERYQNLKIFYDRESIPPGGLWIRKISDAIGHAKKVVCFLSPQYSCSDVCWDEFQCAKLKEYNTKENVIQTIYLHSDKQLPLMMGTHSYIDCREGDSEKIISAVEKVLGVRC